MECFGTTDFDNIIRDYNKRPPLYIYVGLDNKLYKMHSTYFRISKYVILITFPRQHSLLRLYIHFYLFNTAVPIT